MDQPSARSIGCSMYKSNTLKSPAAQEPRLGLVTEGPGTVPLCGRQWAGDLGAPCAAPQPQPGEPLAEDRQGKELGTQMGRDSRSQRDTVPAACPELPGHGPGLCLAALEGTACVSVPRDLGVPCGDRQE